MKSNITIQNYFNYNNWDSLVKALPQKDVEIILKNALPFTILLPSQAGRIIHLCLTLFNGAAAGWEFKKERSFSTAGNLIKHSVDFGASFLTPQKSSLAHTIVSLAENLNEARKGEKEALCLVTSEAFSLGSLLSVSKKRSLQFALVSIVLQALHHFYRMHQAASSSQDHKRMTAISNALMGCIHVLRAYRCYSDLQKVQKLVHQIFILMRHADRGKGEDPDITEEGIARSKLAAPAIAELCKEFGKDKVQVVVSSLKRSQQTGAVIARELGIPLENMGQEPRIVERISSKIPRAERKNHPDYQSYKNLSKEEQFFRRQLPDAESPLEISARMRQGIENNIDSDDKTLTVFVSHTIAIRRFFQGLRLDNFEIPDNFLKGSKFCEISLLDRKGSEDQGFTWSCLKRLQITLPTQAEPNRII